jgi:hypothetical protein
MVASAMIRLANATTSHRLLSMHRSYTSVHGCFGPERSTGFSLDPSGDVTAYLLNVEVL